MIDVHTDLTSIVATRGGHRLASHDRTWASGLTITDSAHIDIAARLRRQFQQHAEQDDPKHPVRDLGDYDRAFGVDFHHDSETEVA